MVVAPNAQAKAPENRQPATPYRIGIVSYDDIRDRALTLQSYFSALGHEVSFASGTAEEVLDWISEGAVDIAILSPGAFTATGPWIEGDHKPDATWSCHYLITHALPISKSPFASKERKTRADLFLYQPLCLMDRKSVTELGINPDNPMEKLKQASAAGKLEFVFADSLSLSGTIVPRAQLNAMKIAWDQCWEFSYGVTDTIDLLLDEPKISVGGKTRHRVGFVFDGTIPKVPTKEPEKGKDEDKQKLLKKRIQEMSRDLVVVKLPKPSEPAGYPIQDLPTEVWVVRPDFKLKNVKELRQQLCDLRIEDPNRSLFNDQSAPEKLRGIGDRVRKWAKEANVQLDEKDEKRQSSISEILASMRHYERRFGKSSRLALVLSGGGAKCAYQAGAIASIERQLLDLRDFKVLDPDARVPNTKARVAPDIKLVAGTSGGALNALPTALGITAKFDSSDTKDSMLASVWESIHLTNLLRPYPIVGAVLGLFLASVLFFTTWLLGQPLVLWGTAAKRSAVESPTLANRLAIEVAIRASFILLVLVEVAVGIFWLIRYFTPQEILLFGPVSAPLYHLFWLPFNLGVDWLLILLTVGVAFRLVSLVRRWTMPPVSFEIRFWRSLALVVLALALLAYMTLWKNRSLSEDTRMRELVANRFVELLKDIRSPTHTDSGEEAGLAITRLSAAICDPDLVRRRDLVMTVSLLTNNGTSDRYLYLPAKVEGSTPNYDQRGIKLGGGREFSYVSEPTKILELMMASGTIFPIFPSHSMSDPASEARMSFVDGGFAHNIPVEAAVDWGATHIVVIEASPELDRNEKPSFIGNVGTAFDHLFAQAQLTDVRSRETVEIYTLRPRKEILKTLDFVPALTKKAVAQGKKDADDGRFRERSRVPKLMRFSP